MISVSENNAIVNTIYGNKDRIPLSRIPGPCLMIDAADFMIMPNHVHSIITIVLYASENNKSQIPNKSQSPKFQITNVTTRPFAV